MSELQQKTMDMVVACVAGGRPTHAKVTRQEQLMNLAIRCYHLVYRIDTLQSRMTTGEESHASLS